MIYFIFIYLTHTSSRYRGVGAHQCQEKKQEGKNEENGLGQKAKPFTPTQSIDACMGEEENRGKKKGNRKLASNPTTWTILSPLTTRMDHTVGIF